ncbi:MAG: dihydroorotate dehydrogenase-like protein [Bacteroidales bacterium]|nr:dihydroorotate dehydrogenase-like protein [Bacteroidales bacterium]
MADLTTHYMGLELKNPLIASSSGFTDSLDKLKTLEEKGIGAVVLKSLFEEEIMHEMEETFTKMKSENFLYPETHNYFEYEDIEDTLSQYIKLISDANKELSIPVIASVNCISNQKWTHFAKELEDAGADGIELNAFILPSDFTRSSEENEKMYFNIIKEVQKHVSIPIALKVSYYFSSLAPTLKELSETGIKALVLFNRFYSPDFNLKTMKVTPSHVLSNASDIAISLRWIAIMAGRVNCSLAASTGVHDGQGFIKQLIAGADAVQIASTIYKNGYDVIPGMLNVLNEWMDEQEFDTINEFKGNMSQKEIKNPAAYERVQFMKYFSEK